MAFAYSWVASNFNNYSKDSNMTTPISRPELEAFLGDKVITHLLNSITVAMEEGTIALDVALDFTVLDEPDYELSPVLVTQYFDRCPELNRVQDVNGILVWEHV